MLGSIPLPSYVIAPVEPDDHINRKYAFKVTVKWQSVTVNGLFVMSVRKRNKLMADLLNSHSGTLVWHCLHLFSLWILFITMIISVIIVFFLFLSLALPK